MPRVTKLSQFELEAYRDRRAVSAVGGVFKTRLASWNDTTDRDAFVEGWAMEEYLRVHGGPKPTKADLRAFVQSCGIIWTT